MPTRPIDARRLPPARWLALAASLGWLPARAQQHEAVPLLCPIAAIVAVAPPVSEQLVRQPGLARWAPPPREALPPPLLLLNSRVLVGFGELAAIAPAKVVALCVYHSGDAPAQWRTLATNGLLDLTVAARTVPASYSLRHLRHCLHLRRGAELLINGLPVSDPSLRIAKATVAAADKQVAAGHEAGAIRLREWVGPPHPPGTILLRGQDGQ